MSLRVIFVLHISMSYCPDKRAVVSEHMVMGCLHRVPPPSHSTACCSRACIGLLRAFLLFLAVQDLFGCGLCATFLSTIRLPSIKVRLDDRTRFAFFYIQLSCPKSSSCTERRVPTESNHTMRNNHGRVGPVFPLAVSRACSGFCTCFCDRCMRWSEKSKERAEDRSGSARKMERVALVDG